MLCSTLWKIPDNFLQSLSLNQFDLFFELIPTHGRMIMISKKMYASSFHDKIGSTTNNVCPNQKDVPYNGF